MRRSSPVDPEDDAGRPGAPIADPLLRVLPAGADSEPEARELHKTQEFESGGRRRRRGRAGWLQTFGPGLITGASDDDPSGIGTYSQVGSQFGYALLWTALFTFPLMAAIQELCARIALHTGVGLATALRRRFPAWVVGPCVLALLVANTINTGADLGAVAAAGSLLSRDTLRESWLVVPIAAVILGLQLFVSYGSIFKIFKWLTVVLFAYVVAGFIVHPDLGRILLASFVPHIEMSKDFIAAVVAIFGTTISPYLFFWQASAEVDEMRAAGKHTAEARRGVTVAELKAARVDIVVGMLFSQLVMFSIIATAAAVLHAHGQTEIQTAAQAAQALAPLAGQWAFVLFALGMIGTGLLAIPILTGSAAYAVRDLFGLKGALADRPAYRPTFYGIMVLATLAGIAINLIGVNPIRALYVAAIINGLVAPPLMVLIVILGSTPNVMGKRTSGALSKTLCWIATTVMGVAATALVLTQI